MYFRGDRRRFGWQPWGAWRYGRRFMGAIDARAGRPAPMPRMGVPTHGRPGGARPIGNRGGFRGGFGGGARGGFNGGFRSFGGGFNPGFRGGFNNVRRWGGEWNGWNPGYGAYPYGADYSAMPYDDSGVDPSMMQQGDPNAMPPQGGDPNQGGPGGAGGPGGGDPGQGGGGHKHDGGGGSSFSFSEIPTWGWVAGGVGALLLLTRR